MNSYIKLIVIFFVISVPSSCKQNADKSEKINEIEKQSAKPNVASNEAAHFFITLNALIKQDDQLQLFYIQDQSETYSPNQMILKDVSGSDTYQEIRIDLPDGDYPLNFRLDLGTNAQQGSIQIEQCILNYGTKSFMIKGDDILMYFKPNDGVEMSSDIQMFKLKTYKVNEQDKYDPFLVGNQKLNEVLIKNL